MKPEAHNKAVELRKKGLTYAEIGRLLDVSKGSLSNWLKEIPYKPSDESVKRRRLASIQNGNVLRKRKIQRISKIMYEAEEDVTSLSTHTLRLLGIIAYWCEGSKTVDNIVKFTNSDSKLIRLMVKWFIFACNVPQAKIRIHLRIHKDVNIDKAKKYWSNITDIPINQFYRTTIKKSESDGRRYSQLPYGIASIIVCDTDLFYRIKGWIQALAEKFNFLDNVSYGA